MSSYNWSSIAGGGSGGVTSLNTLSGALTLSGGTGISITDNGSNTITITNTQDLLTLAAFGSSPNANAASLSGQILTLQPASASFPGGVSTGTQSFAGIKTFGSILNADGGIDRSSAGTLTIGATNATTINIGNAGAIVNIQGTTIYENTPVLQVTDPLITVNKGGGAGSGQNSGIEIEESGSITGYAETSADRNSWIFKAPNTAGIATVTPGAGGITLDQSSHNPVTIGTANGLSLSTQALSLAAASGSVTGALTSTDWTTFNNKQAAGNYITALTGDVTASGPGSVASTLATVNSNVGSFTYSSITVNGKGLITAASSGAAPVTTLAAIGASPNANGMTFSGNTLNLEPANASFGGVVTTGTQTIAGAKTLSNDLTLSTLLALPTTSSTAGQITLNSSRFLHAFGTNNTFLGSGAGNFTLTGAGNTGIGDSALAATSSGARNTVIGYGAGVALNTGVDNVIIGKDAGKLFQGAGTNVIIGSLAQPTNTGLTNSVVIGYSATVGSNNNSIAIGNFAAAIAANQVAFGSGNSAASNIYFGTGPTGTSSPGSYSILGSVGSGTDIAGSTVTIGGGIATGAGAPGQIQFKTTTVGTTGSVAQTYSTRGGFDGAGGFFQNGTTSGTLTLKAAAATTSHTLTYPSAQGAANSVLTNDGSGGLSWATPGVQAKTANYTVVATDKLIKVDSSGGAFSITLLSAATYSGQEITVVATAVGSNAGVDLKTTSSQTIGGLASANIILNTAQDTITVVSDGSNWQIKNWGIDVSCRYNGQPTGTINSSTDNVFPTKKNDVNTDYNNSTGVYTCRYAGTYNLSVAGLITITTGSFTSVQILLNGSAEATAVYPYPSNFSNDLSTPINVASLKLAAGDTIKVRFNANGSPTFNASVTYSWFSIAMTER